MDIKWKDIKYSIKTKAIAVILIWLCFLCVTGGALLLLVNREIANSESYYETHKFKYKFEMLVRNTIEANVEQKNSGTTEASGEAGNTIVENAVAESAANEDTGYINSIKSEISGMVNYVYYIKNTLTGKVITNIAASEPIELIKRQPIHAYINQWKSTFELSTYGSDIREMLKGTYYEVYVAVQEPLKRGDEFYTEAMKYRSIKDLATYAYPLMIAALVLLVVSATYLAIVAGRKERGGEIILTSVDKIYADVHTLLVLFAAFLSVMISVNGSVPNDIITWMLPILVLSADAFIGISYVLSMIRQFKAGCIFRNTLTAVLYKKLIIFAKLCFEGKLFRPSLLLVLLGYGLINGILFDIGVDISQGDQEPAFTVLLIIFNVAAVYFSAKSLLSLSQIMMAAKEISSGNIDYAINSSEMSVTFSSMAEDIKNIQGGLKKAVTEAVKGERMKTELITNVSHDLKTPLTSIVNYVDLLKKEDLDNERAEEYISILEEKSARLKQLVEDLVEASKASSGTLNVNAEKVDLHELVLQACGEYEEKIKKSELDVRISADEKNTYVYADGKQMWRIIENLLSNAIKYSMPGSRVYINIVEGNGYGSFIIKNISAFPLDIPPEQLTERFVRGDASRSTEGSGLGLSIAQSLTALQRGRFKIEIDGDLFKASVEIPVWREILQ